jgi:parallel beta helix pectate lyase-like protein
MTTRTGIFASIAALAFFCPVFTTIAQAQQASFVSTTGNNANDCSRETPCLTLQRGINAVAAAGVVHILDSGAYGQNIMITKSVTVAATGVVATIGSITINATGGAVALRGLHITGRNNSGFGGTLTVQSAASVHVENCDVEGAAGNSNGMNIDLDDGLVTITQSTFRNNGFYGVLITTSSQNAEVVIEQSRFLNNITGIRNAGSGTQLSIEQSTIAGNSVFGLSVGNTGIARISNSVAVNNGTGLQNSGAGTLLSRGNNTVNGNTTNTAGGITPLAGT